MRHLHLSLLAFVMSGLISSAAFADAPDAPPVQQPSSEADIKAALTGGVPLGRWNEGLLFEGISPQPWMKSAAYRVISANSISTPSARFRFKRDASNAAVP